MYEPNTTENIIRDLKGHIDGKKYTNKNGQITEIDKPSMAKKIAFVTDNISTLGAKYGFDAANIRCFEGVVITMDYPLISEYSGVKMLSIGQISNLE